jgi:hypothetical protein
MSVEGQKRSSHDEYVPSALPCKADIKIFHKRTYASAAVVNQIINFSRCFDHSTGKPPVKSLIESLSPCRPSRILGTMSGASSVNRKIRQA